MMISMIVLFLIKNKFILLMILHDEGSAKKGRKGGEN
jgi:hypothetical protein